MLRPKRVVGVNETLLVRWSCSLGMVRGNGQNLAFDAYSLFRRIWTWYDVR